MGICGYSI